MGRPSWGVGLKNFIVNPCVINICWLVWFWSLWYSNDNSLTSFPLNLSVEFYASAASSLHLLTLHLFTTLGNVRIMPSWLSCVEGWLCWSSEPLWCLPKSVLNTLNSIRSWLIKHNESRKWLGSLIIQRIVWSPFRRVPSHGKWINEFILCE